MNNEKKVIEVSVSINASLDKAWECWTKPEHIINWNFASPDWCCPAAQNDIRTGGKFSWRMEARDGSMGFDMEGTYTNVIPQQQIEYVMPDDRKVQLTFRSVDGRTEVTEKFEAENMNSHELQRQGWQSILDNYRSYVESR